MHTLPLSIAVLDDESQMRRALRRLLGSHGHEVTLFATGRELLATPADRRFDCILLDLNMPELNGYEVLEALAVRKERPPVIVITALDRPGEQERTRALGACGFLPKPVAEDSLMKMIECCTLTASAEPAAH